MPASSDRIEFTPPQEPGFTRAFALAILAHVLLMIALTWGINWNREKENLSAEAELWSSVPQQAAPKLVETPPPPPPPPPEPQKRVETPPPPPVATPKAPDIALEREKKRQELARQHQEELERQKKIEARKKLEEQKREQLAAKKEAEERKRREDEQKTAKAKKQQAEEKRAAALREEQIRRMQGLAGATGAPTATGTAQKSSGPSDSYAGRVRARVKPNIVFTDDIAGNPTAEIEVRLAPDGTIVGSRVLKSSGVKSWDDAVLRALVKTEVLPRDVDGRVPTPLIIEFRPKG